MKFLKHSALICLTVLLVTAYVCIWLTQLPFKFYSELSEIALEMIKETLEFIGTLIE